MGFDHVDVRVKDRPKARRFFVEQLGMDVIGEGPDHTFLLFGDQVLGLLRDAAGRFGATVLMATHSTEAARIASTLVQMRDGRVCAVERS